jgi:hypothetical protein
MLKTQLQFSFATQHACFIGFAVTLLLPRYRKLPGIFMGACCSRRSNKIAAEQLALKDAISSEVRESMQQHHRMIATTDHGSIVRLSDGQQVHPLTFLPHTVTPHNIPFSLQRSHLPAMTHRVSSCSRTPAVCS